MGAESYMRPEELGRVERSTLRLPLVLACLTGLFLSHSANVGGVNLSIADILLVLTLLALVALQRIIVPPFIVVFFTTLVIVSGLTAMVATPITFGVSPDSGVLSDLLKTFVSLLYLICGVGIAGLRVHIDVLRWFAFGAAGVAIFGIAMEVTGIRLMAETMYYGGIRFRGFMVDPNYWAVLASSAIAFLAWDRGVRPIIRAGLIISLVISVFLSGSKTGLITLLALGCLLLFGRINRSKNKLGLRFALSLAIVLVAISFTTIIDDLQRLVNQYIGVLPQLARVSVLIQDPLGAITEGGSGRSSAWESGLTMIERSPFVGVGIGAYRAVNGALFGETTLAHNTYLQLAAEWGLPLAALFFGWLVVLLVRASRQTTGSHDSRDVVAVRNMVIVFLIGSMSLSLNNARMFWLFLGILIYLVYYLRGKSVPEPRNQSAVGDDRGV